MNRNDYSAVWIIVRSSLVFIWFVYSLWTINRLESDNYNLDKDNWACTTYQANTTNCLVYTLRKP